MFTLLRSRQRRHLQRGQRSVWQSFFVPEDSPASLAAAFGSLLAFDELRLPPGDSTDRHTAGDAEQVTYLYAGALSQQDSAGSSTAILAGAFQHMSTGDGPSRAETNRSSSIWAHVFRISVRPGQVGLARAHEQERFTAAQRRNVLCVVASPDGRKGSLRLHQDALVYSSILEPGRHLAHQLPAGRGAWLHVLCGEVTLKDVVLTKGDGVGLTEDPAVSLTATEDTEVLLIDVGLVAPAG